MNNKNISIIVIAYNSENYIERCIRSLINQTYKNIEIIVVNDGSTDKTIDILNKYKNSIKIYEKANEGVANARNFGIKKCQTEYFMFVDSDDYLEENAVKMLYTKLVETNSDIVMGSTNNSLKEMLVLEENKFDYLFNNKIKYFMVPWNKLYKKEIFSDLKYPNLTLAEDEYLIHHILDKIRKMVIIPEKTYNYFHNPNGLTTTKLQNYKDIICAFKDRYNFFKNTKYEKIAYKQYMNYYINIFCQLKRKNITQKELVYEFRKNIVLPVSFKYLLFANADEIYYKLFALRSKIWKKYQ